MSSRDFCYWLMGFFEIHDAGNPMNVKIDKGLIGEKVETIKKHLALVFKHEIDPAAGGEKVQSELNQMHHGDDPNVTYRC